MPKINKEYKVFDFKSATSKSGKPYASFKIKDTKRDDNQEGGWASTFYKVLIFDNITIPENAKVNFKLFREFAYEEREYNGQTYRDLIIYAHSRDFEIIGEAANGSVSTPFDNMEPIPENSGFKAPWD